MATYIFDHGWLAVTALRQGRPILAGRLGIAVATLLLLKPRAVRGLLRIETRAAT
jgi:hypothetical protein